MTFVLSNEPKGEAKDFAIPTAGMKQAVCIGVYDLGWHKSFYKKEDGSDKFQHKCALTFEVDEVNQGEGDFTGKRFIVSKQYTASMHEKASLRKEIGSWRGAEVSDEEAKSFDLEQLIGQKATINITHETRDGKTYYRLANILPPMGEGLTEVENDVPFPAPEWVTKKQAEARGSKKTEATADELPLNEPLYPADAKNQQRISEYNMLTMRMKFTAQERVDHLKASGNDFALAIQALKGDDVPV